MDPILALISEMYANLQQAAQQIRQKDQTILALQSELSDLKETSAP